MNEGGYTYSYRRNPTLILSLRVYSLRFSSNSPVSQCNTLTSVIFVNEKLHYNPSRGSTSLVSIFAITGWWCAGGSNTCNFFYKPRRPRHSPAPLVSPMPPKKAIKSKSSKKGFKRAREDDDSGVDPGGCAVFNLDRSSTSSTSTLV
jgi:hypothetical protein